MSNLSDIFKDSTSIISLIIPFLIVLLLILNSIINTNIKGFIYFMGILLIIGFIKMFAYNNLVTEETPSQHICKLLNINGVPNQTISLSSSILSFTFTYIFAPMFIHNTFNNILLIFIILSGIIDSKVKIDYQCETLKSIIIGIVLGIVIGFIYFIIIFTISKDSKYSLIYYDDFMSNKVACSRPTKQKFKCNVYKNGELISTL